MSNEHIQQPPQWLINEAEMLYPYIKGYPSMYRQLQLQSHINAVMGVIEKVAEKSWWAAIQFVSDNINSSLVLHDSPDTAKHQFINKLKSEGV
jgi:hypothetical protein